MRNVHQIIIMVNSRKNAVIEEILFSSNGFLLKGYLHLPPIDQAPVVIGSHGLFSDKNSPKQIELAHKCNQSNIAYFRFDHRGCGESKAPFEALTSLEVRYTDLITAAHILKARPDIGNKMALFGSSMGGTVCLAVASDAKIDAVVTWAAPIRSTDLVQKATNLRRISDSNIPFKRNPFDISNRLARVQNILVFHGAADETVPLSHANEIYKHVSEPKKLIVFPQSDHRMSNLAHQKDFIRQAIAWFRVNLIPE